MVSVTLSLVLNQLKTTITNLTPRTSYFLKLKQKKLEAESHFSYEFLIIYASQHQQHILNKNKKNSHNKKTIITTTTSTTTIDKNVDKSSQHKKPSLEKEWTNEEIKRQQHISLKQSKYRVPRGTIVLCHGLYGFDVRGPHKLPFLQIHYWGGIEKALAKLGANVIVTSVPRTGSIWERALALHDFLNTAFTMNHLHQQPINFIAHSMGGLDCRYLLSHLDNQPRNYQPLSLTTISCPHRGSPVMDWFRDHVGVGLMSDTIKSAAIQKMKENSDIHSSQMAANTTIAPSLNNITSPSSSSPSSPLASWTSLSDIVKMPSYLLDPMVQKIIQLLDTPAYANLTTDYCQQYFNPNTPDNPSVAYYSYGASTTLPVWSFLGLPNQLVREKEGDNDGLVSVKSAKWGKYIKTLQNVDHWSLNGERYRWLPSLSSSSSSSPTSTTTMDGNHKFDVVEFYLELANYLYEHGH
ncbi:unnamed protein product [Cunninghamella echinulata]